MFRPDRGHARLAAWLALAFLSILTLYWGQLSLLASGLDQLLTSTLGTVFPAYPFLALLVLLTALRWKDFHGILLAEEGVLTRPKIRIAGVALILLPEASLIFVPGQVGAQSQYLAMEVAATLIVLVAYGSLLVTSPSMWKVMFPYAALYTVGLVSPLFLLNTLGAPLALLSSHVAGGMTKALGIPVVWQGVSFALVSVAGDQISSVVTPACSAVYSISIYLGLLGLMYLDMRTDISTLTRYAVVGVALIPLIDSARIAFMIWYGFEWGSAAFWGIHDWLGFLLFFAFYLGVLLAYSKKASDTRGGPEMFAPIVRTIRLARAPTIVKWFGMSA